ncbi:MAG TPA: hypothetical protein PKK06_15185 [Phycisphaerae bacterium]|nr:hypothetical protein [Phycisphaerae bacterium]HNU46693.1 hypothetical protein [Phycisphaerae bacterium]
MARILLIHSDGNARKFLEARAGGRHQVHSVGDMARGIRALEGMGPDLLIAGIDHHKPEALDLLRYLRRNGRKVPVLLVGPAGAGVLQPAAMKLGAAAFLEYPVEQLTLEQAISDALEQARDRERSSAGRLPRLASEEETGNVSQLQERLNERMECFAGKNQVYLQALILGPGQKSKPRVALKCPLRKQYGYPPDVYYEYIRDVCCGRPSECPAFRTFQKRSGG